MGFVSRTDLALHMNTAGHNDFARDVGKHLFGASFLDVCGSPDAASLTSQLACTLVDLVS